MECLVPCSSDSSGPATTATRDAPTARWRPPSGWTTRPRRPRSAATRRWSTSAPRNRRRPATPAALAVARERQRDAFGGLNWGASFFGWLVAVGVAALLSSILVAAGAAIGITESDVTTAGQDELTLGGGIALLAVLVVAYATGGYVAGRMSRFDGGRQGLGTWAIGLVVMVALALAAVILGDEYNVLEQLNLPSFPVADGESFASGGALTLAISIVATVLAAVAGGKAGERYHKRVDRAGFVD